MNIRLCALLCVILSAWHIAGVQDVTAQKKVFKVAMLGFGGRAQGLLRDFLRECPENTTIQVVAVCDDNAQASFDFFVNKALPNWRHADEAQINAFKQAVDGAVYYADNKEDIQRLFAQHKDIDQVVIASSNDRHFEHLSAALSSSACKRILVEKPLFRNLSEWEQFNAQADTSGATIHVGLSLRYSPIARIAGELLATHAPELGTLEKIRSWEHVNFGHALTIIMMNWRRFKDQSGGLLLEKSIHDLDLFVWFMQAAGYTPQAMTISTQSAHEFFKKSRHQEMLAKLLEDQELRQSCDRWESIPFKRIVPFCYDAHGAVDWKGTLEGFFKDFPQDDQLQQSNIIPDRHKVQAIIETLCGKKIDFELDLKLNDFQKVTKRGTRFVFEHGDAVIDFESGIMSITKKNSEQQTQEFDLKISGLMHAGGDACIAQTVLGTLPEGHVKAMFNGNAVQLATLMGLVSEDQAARNSMQPTRIQDVNGKWTIQDN